jgi:hypothetical protein
MMRLNIKSFALAAGLFWGLTLLAYAWWRLLLEGEESEDQTVIGRKYPGFSISPLGGLIGFGWGLADGAAKGTAFAWLYNELADRLPQTMRLRLPGAGL